MPLVAAETSAPPFELLVTPADVVELGPRRAVREPGEKASVASSAERRLAVVPSAS